VVLELTGSPLHPGVLGALRILPPCSRSVCSAEYPAAAAADPLSTWDLSWLDELIDSRFIESLG